MSPDHPPKHEPPIGAQVCIIWHPSSRPPTPALLRALRNKGMALIDAPDAHTAFAATARVARTARRTVLVLDTRDELHDVDRVVSAIQRFQPQVLCWAHTPGANPPLVPLVQARSGSPKAEPVLATNHPPAPLRLVGQQERTESQKQTPEPTPLKPPAAVKQGQPLNARDVLDADELNALLAGEIGDRQT